MALLALSLALTLEVGKTAILLDDSRLSWQPPVLGAHAAADISVLR